MGLLITSLGLLAQLELLFRGQQGGVASWASQSGI